MRTILIPCDGSDNALRAVRYAASLAKELSDVRLEFEKLVRDTGPARGDKTGELEPVRGDDVLPVGTGALAARDLWWPARVQPPL